MKLLLEVIFLLGTIIFSLFALLSLDAGGLSDFLGLMVKMKKMALIFIKLFFWVMELSLPRNVYQIR